MIPALQQYWFLLGKKVNDDSFAEGMTSIEMTADGSTIFASSPFENSSAGGFRVLGYNSGSITSIYSYAHPTSGDMFGLHIKASRDGNVILVVDKFSNIYIWRKDGSTYSVSTESITSSGLIKEPAIFKSGSLYYIASKVGNDVVFYSYNYGTDTLNPTPITVATLPASTQMGVSCSYDGGDTVAIFDRDSNTIQTYSFNGATFDYLSEIIPSVGNGIYPDYSVSDGSSSSLFVSDDGDYVSFVTGATGSAGYSVVASKSGSSWTEVHTALFGEKRICYTSSGDRVFENIYNLTPYKIRVYANDGFDNYPLEQELLVEGNDIYIADITSNSNDTIIAYLDSKLFATQAKLYVIEL